jgi:glycosyltransferase involved in cell wall biosynthesis
MKYSTYEITVVIPCLNEQDTLGTCLDKINRVFNEQGYMGEIVVADNGSTDKSVEIALKAGANVIHVLEKGYGNALMSGIESAKGRFILMGDADDSYDFMEIPKFIERIREGYDLVQGCRLPRGGGEILQGAMPWSHRWIGNPVFSFLCRTWFKAPISDVYCGMRCFTKSFYQQLNLRCTGMEFATEMIIKASLCKASISEVAITLHPDGRIKHPPHLRTVRDGWRTLRFFLLCSPRWLFLFPGIALIGAGFFLGLMAMSGFSVGGIAFDVHTLLFACVAVLSGYQAILFAIMSKTFAVNSGIYPNDKFLDLFYRCFNLEKGLLAGLLVFIFGFVLFAWTLWVWKSTGWGELDYAHTMRRAIPSAFMIIAGVQTVTFSFFTSILGLVQK